MWIRCRPESLRDQPLPCAVKSGRRPLVGEVGVDALRNLLGIGPDVIGETGGYGWDRTDL